jgi:outer membrane immunogenic protein
MAPRGPVYKAAPATLFNWTGVYAGGHVGYGWGQADGSNTGWGVADTDGWFGGGQVGVNYQFAPNWVWGVEADISGGDISGRSSSSPSTRPFKTDMLGTARLRLGYTVDRVMFYGTGGLAWAHSKATWVSDHDSNTSIGWALGGGIEYAFAPNWSAKLEYIHADYGHDDYNLAPTTRMDVKNDTVKVGVNYLFNTGGR